MIEDRLRKAVAKIASAQKPCANGQYTPLSRAQMIDIARIACAVGGIKCTAAAAWDGEMPPEPFVRQKKKRLRPRLLVNNPNLQVFSSRSREMADLQEQDIVQRHSISFDLEAPIDDLPKAAPIRGHLMRMT